MRNRVSNVLLGLLMTLLPVIADAGDPGPFKIGIVIPFSGSSAEYGKYIREGFELAQAQSSRGNGIKLIFEDDECIGSRGAAATQKLIDIEKVDVIFGGFCSAVAMAQIPIIQRNGIVQIANAVAPQIRDAGEWVYRINPDGESFLEVLVPFLVGEQKLKRWGILHIANDYGNSQSDSFQSIAKSLGANVAAVEEYLPGTNDFRTQIMKLKRQNLDGVFLVGYAESISAIRQISEAGMKAVIAPSTTFDNPNLWSLIGNIDNVVFFPSCYDPDSSAETMKAFRKAYQDHFSVPPTQYAMMSFEAFGVLEQVSNICAHDRKCMRERLDQDSFPGVQGALSFDKYGDSIRPIYVKKLDHGVVSIAKSQISRQVNK